MDDRDGTTDAFGAARESRGHLSGGRWATIRRRNPGVRCVHIRLPGWVFQQRGKFGRNHHDTPNPLPSPITQLTAARLGYSDPTGTINTASASLGLGTLGAFDSGSLTGGTNGPSSALYDVVHFQITDRAPSVSIGVNIHLNGTESGVGEFSNVFDLSFGGGLEYGMSNLGGYPNNFNVDSLSGWGSPIFTNESAGGFNFSGTIDVTNGEAVPLLMALQLYCVSGEICDFSHTAALSFTLPSDVTFTSDSGVLLTQTSGSAAPEPASFLLLGAGLAALAARTLVRHRRNSY